MYKKENGFTLLEMIITGAIIIIVCCIFLIPFFLSTHKSLQQQNNRTLADQNARLTVDWLVPKIRGAYSPIHNREIGNQTSKKIFYSTNNGTSSLLTLLAYSTDRNGNIRKGTNTITGTQTAIWNVYHYRLEHKRIKFDDELREDRYEVLNTNDADPFIGSWTALSSVKESVKFTSYIRPHIGTNTGLQFEYWNVDGNPCSNPEDAIYITIKVNTKVGSGTPYCHETYIETDAFLRRKSQNF